MIAAPTRGCVTHLPPLYPRPARIMPRAAGMLVGAMVAMIAILSIRMPADARGASRAIFLTSPNRKSFFLAYGGYLCFRFD